MKLLLARLVLWLLCAGGFLGFNALVYVSADGGHTGWEALVGFYSIVLVLGAMYLAGHWAIKTIRNENNHKKD